MRVSTKIITGFATVLLVALGALTYQVTIVHKMQSINKDLSQVNFEAATVVQHMVQQMLDLEENIKKYFVTNGDPIYVKELADLRAEVGVDLGKLQGKAHTPPEREAVKELSAAWSEFWRLFDEWKDRVNPDAGPVDFPAVLQDALDNVYDRTQATLAAVRVGIREQVDAAAKAGEKARMVSFVAGGASLLIAVVVAILLVRAIADPLRQLTQGTRRISKGQFWHRLPTYSGDEFSELARDFNAMAQRLSELDQMKKDFVSHVSHELKAPLASMRQVFLLLLRQLAGPLSEQQRRLLQTSSHSAERLSAMVGNLLDVSRMEAGTMEYDLHPNDVVGLVCGVVEEFEVQAKERRIELKVEASNDAWADCDRDRVVQVIGNLLENALKFSPEGGVITTRVENTDARKVLIAVSDSGPGVADEHKSRIFGKFHQVKQGKKISGQGVGLGLAICRTIVGDHGGTIWVEDNPEGGSIFCFLLRAVDAPTANTAKESIAAGQSQ
jgi:two-component system, NtrC family, sensor histidine kinase GlrK